MATERLPPLRPARTLLLWLVLSCWLPAIAGIAVLFFHMYQDGRARLEKTTIETARALVQVVDGELMRAQAVAQALSTSDRLAQRDFAGFHRQASAVLHTTGIGVNLVLSDAAGARLLNTLHPYGEPDSSNTDLAHVQRVVASGKPVTSNIAIGPVSGAPALLIHVPVMSNGRVAYVLGIGIGLEQFSNILRQQRLPPGWITTITDHHGTLAARTQNERLLVGKTVPPRIVPHLKATSAAEGGIETPTLEGIPSRVSYSRSALSHWSVLIAIPLLSFEQDLMRTVFPFGLGIAILLGISAALAWVVGGRIARSVQALTAPAIALEAGMAPAPVSTVYLREADDVAQAMARTAHLLVQRTQALHQSYETLEKSEKYFRSIMSSVIDNIVVLDATGAIRYINHVAPGRSAADAIGANWITWLEPADQAAASRSLRHTLATGESSSLEMTAPGINRRVRAYQVNLSAIPSADSPQVVLIARDVTEITLAGAALLRSRTSLRRLVEHQEVIKEYERKRIARDVHDDLGQNLLVLRIDLSMMAARPGLDALSRQQLATTLKQIDITILAVKDIINDLRPPVLSLGLHAAIEWQSREFERRTGIDCEFTCDLEELTLDDQHATSLFRIVQESLANIARHAYASHSRICIECREDQLFMTIIDDGIGLSVDAKTKDNSFGLVGIEERIDAMGGKCAIANNPGRGVAVMLSIPYPKATIACNNV